MNMAQVIRLKTAVDGSVTRLQNVLTEVSPHAEGGEHYWIGMADVLIGALTKLRDELQHDIDERRS